MLRSSSALSHYLCLIRISDQGITDLKDGTTFLKPSKEFPVSGPISSLSLLGLTVASDSAFRLQSKLSFTSVVAAHEPLMEG
jgi:hypothetical protein